MFSVTTNDPKLLRDSIDTISQLIDEGLFKLKRDGIQLLATDRAMVAVVDFKLDASAFEEYKCDKEATIGLNLLNLLTILKRAGSEDKLTMILNETDNKLEITLKGNSTRNFAIPLLEISQEEIPPVSQLVFASTAELRAGILDQGIADADIIADSVIIELADGKLRMFAEGDSSKTELILEQGNESLINMNSRESVKSRYPLDYLKKMIKASKIADNVKLELGTDYPLRIGFKGEHASMVMVLAPRVSEE